MRSISTTSPTRWRTSAVSWATRTASIPWPSTRSWSASSCRRPMPSGDCSTMPPRRICDLPAPIKREPEMRVYRAAEDRLLAAVAAKFGLAPTLPASVAEADRIVLATEFRDVTTVDDLDWIVAECGFAPSECLWITPWPPAVAEDRFLRRFWELTR